MLVAWEISRRGPLTKVYLKDREGRNTRLTLAWDSYSDAQLDAFEQPVVSRKRADADGHRSRSH